MIENNDILDFFKSVVKDDSERKLIEMLFREKNDEKVIETLIKENHNTHFKDSKKTGDINDKI